MKMMVTIHKGQWASPNDTLTDTTSLVCEGIL